MLKRCGKLEKKYYALVALAVLVAAIVAFSPFRVSADMGPKPSAKISIDVGDYDGAYYAVFLREEKYFLHELLPSEEDVARICQEEDLSDYETEYRIAHNYDGVAPALRTFNETLAKQGKWRILLSGNDLLTPMTGRNASLAMTYHAPPEFKIAVVLEDGRYYISQTTQRKAFESFYAFDVDTAQDSLTDLPIQFDAKGWRFAVQIVVRLAATLAIELLIALLFVGLKKRPYKIIAIVNTITNLALNVGFILLDYFNGFQPMDYFLFLWAAEAAVCVVEAVVYCKTIREVPRWRLIVYAIVANAASFLCGFYVGALLTQAL